MPRSPETRFDDLYLRHQRMVLAYACRRVGSADADDVVAETFMAAWRNLDRLPLDPEAWLLTTARHIVLRHHRSKVRLQGLRLRLRHEPPPAPVEADAGPADLIEALCLLSEKDREVLMLVCWEGRSLIEVGQILGTSHSAARQRFQRARARLARILGDAPSTHMQEEHA